MDGWIDAYKRNDFKAVHSSASPLLFIFSFDFSSASGTSDAGRLDGRRKCEGRNASCVLTVDAFLSPFITFIIFFSGVFLFTVLGACSSPSCSSPIQAGS